MGTLSTFDSQLSTLSLLTAMDLLTLHFQLENLYAAYAECLDEGELERWPEFFTEDCLYQIIPRENFERHLPLALMRCESKGMLKDRVAAVRQTSVYAPRTMRHLVSNIRVIGDAGGIIHARANYAVLETPLDEPTRVFNTGRYLDRLVHVDGSLKFSERLCVFDSILIPGSLVYPI